jgi:hypothetical protein
MRQSRSHADGVRIQADCRLGTLILQQSAAMNQPMIWITAPDLSQRATVRFSAYGFGWGYRAFSVSYEAVCESLGAGDTTEEQIRLAFQLGKRQILRAVLQHESIPYRGQRISLCLEGPSHPISLVGSQMVLDSGAAGIDQSENPPFGDSSLCLFDPTNHARDA